MSLPTSHTCTPLEPDAPRTLCEVCSDVLVADDGGGYRSAPTDFPCSVCGSDVRAGECVYHRCRMTYGDD